MLNMRISSHVCTRSTKPNTAPPFPFHWAPLGFVYLGIFMALSFNQLYKAHFVFWNSLPDSLLERIKIECVAKMVQAHPMDSSNVFKGFLTLE